MPCASAVSRHNRYAFLIGGETRTMRARASAVNMGLSRKQMPVDQAEAGDSRSSGAIDCCRFDSRSINSTADTIA